MSSVPHQRTCPQRNPPHQRSDSVSPDVGTAKFPENYQSALYQKRRGSVPFHGKWISDLPFQFPKYLISVDFMCRFFIYTKKKVHDQKFKHEIAFPLYPHDQTREDTEWLKPQVLIKKTVHLNISYRCAFFWCGIHLISKSRIDSTAQDYRNYDTETLWNSHIKLLQSVESESNKYITALYL